MFTDENMTQVGKAYLGIGESIFSDGTRIIMVRFVLPELIIPRIGQIDARWYFVNRVAPNAIIHDVYPIDRVMYREEVMPEGYPEYQLEHFDAVVRSFTRKDPHA